MAASAALVSVMQIIDQIQLHPRPPISLHQNQVASLTQTIAFIQDFLECYNPHLTYNTEADPLESRIADAAYAAEDVIESHIVDQILGKNISSIVFYQGLQKVITVGFDDVLYQMLEKMIRGRLDLQIIPMVGMGGIGKTTLARNIYFNPLVEQYFDVCAWCAISQEYNAQEIIRQVLDQVDKKDREKFMSGDELGEQLYNPIFNRKEVSDCDGRYVEY